MARKTAMGKEPGSVSIAIPQSEKDRLRNSGKFQPGDPGMAEKIAKGAKPFPLKRLSPGVYRNGAGELVGSKGQVLPGGRSPSLTERALNAANRAIGNQDRRFQTQGSLVGNVAGNQAQQIADNLTPQNPMTPQQQGEIDRNVRQFIGEIQQPGFQMPNNFMPYPMQMQNQMSDLMYRFPQGQNFNQWNNTMFRPQQPGQVQPQQPVQPNSISGLLQRYR